MLSFKKGQVVYVVIDDKAKFVGHEQWLNRPCIIIQSLNKAKLATIVPVSTKKNLDFHYSVVKIPAGAGGLKEESYALCHQITTISFERISNVKGQLPEREFNKVRTVLRDYLEL